MLEDPITFRGVLLSVGAAMQVQLRVMDMVTDISSESGFTHVPLESEGAVASFQTRFRVDSSGGAIDCAVVAVDGELALEARPFYYYIALAVSWTGQPSIPERSPHSRTSFIVYNQIRLMAETGIRPAYLKMDEEAALWRGARLGVHEINARAYACDLRPLHQRIVATLLSCDEVTVDANCFRLVDSFLLESKSTGLVDFAPSGVVTARSQHETAILKMVFDDNFVQFVSTHAVGSNSLSTLVLLMLSFDLTRIRKLVTDGSRTTPLGYFREFLDEIISRWQNVARVDSPLGEYLRFTAPMSTVCCHFHLRQAWTRALTDLVKNVHERTCTTGSSAMKDKEREWMQEHGVQGAYICIWTEFFVQSGALHRMLVLLRGGLHVRKLGRM
jgi:hypothetical protein